MAENSGFVVYFYVCSKINQRRSQRRPGAICFILCVKWGVFSISRRKRKLSPSAECNRTPRFSADTLHFISGGDNLRRRVNTSVLSRDVTETLNSGEFTTESYATARKHRNASCNFSVREYARPHFGIKINGPRRPRTSFPRSIPKMRRFRFLEPEDAGISCCLSIVSCRLSFVSCRFYKTNRMRCCPLLVDTDTS